MSKAFEKQAIALQEALELSHTDICKSLSDELKDMFPGQYAYVCDVYGDSESGDVVYYCNGETWKAPYEIGEINGKRETAIDDDQAINVVPRTVYDEEADEEDHYAGMTQEQVAERFVSKAERDAADSGDFAGKGKSFPILKPADVMAAVRSMGRAGSDNKSTGALKSSIIRIAKKKGWTKYLPKAWQDGDSKESLVNGKGELVLCESAATLETIVLKEAKADYEIKLIAPGKGSSAFYPKEVLQRDGPKVFKAGTHVYLNHPTAAEEAARPEGDVKNLAGVLSTDATYNESHTKGPGLYARMKVFADHASTVEEKASHVGMSIRASGIAESGARKEGLPVLKELTHAESVDVVTRAGAGGMILTEAARPQSQKEGDMSPEEVKTLVESSVKAALTEAQKPLADLRQRAIRGDAREEAARLLESVTLPEKAKTRIIQRALTSTFPLTADGSLDMKAFSDFVVAEAQAEGAYLASITGSGRILGMGSAGTVVEIDKKSEKKLRKEAERAQKNDLQVMESLLGSHLQGDALKNAALKAVEGRAR